MEGRVSGEEAQEIRRQLAAASCVGKTKFKSQGWSWARRYQTLQLG